MKVFVKNLIFFILPLFIGFVILMVIPVDNKFQYYNLNEHCGKREWLYDRIFINEAKTDIVFIGSSHTMNAINDSILQAELGKQVINYGYCGLGRSIEYSFIKNILETKDPETIIIEIREKDSRFGHEDFGRIADPQDVFFPPMLINQHYFRDVFTFLELQFFYRRDQVRNEVEYSNSNVSKNTGYYPITTTADEAYLYDVRQRKEQKEAPEPNSYIYNYSKTYLKKIAEMADSEGVEIKFLYIPSFASPSLPLEYDFYKKYGKVILPPDSIYADVKNWMDAEHLNSKGAEELSRWLMQEFK